MENIKTEIEVNNTGVDVRSEPCVSCAFACVCAACVCAVSKSVCGLCLCVCVCVCALRVSCALMHTQAYLAAQLFPEGTTGIPPNEVRTHNVCLCVCVCVFYVCHV